jgi:hypothetical protein
MIERFNKMTDKYRFETGTLFEYNAEQNAYIACFTDYRANTKTKAIKAYEELLNG